MNVYLDIDGVLLRGGKMAEFAEPFLAQILNNWPYSTYWLSSYCWQGQNRAPDVIKPLLRKQSSLKLIDLVQPTDWDELKTDGIDFKTPFLWFDNNISNEEKQILEHHHAVGCFRHIDLSADPHQLFSEMIYLKSLAQN